MDALIGRIETLLEDKFGDARVEELSAAPGGGRIDGVLVWQGFGEDDQVQRQKALWQVLRRHLDPLELQKSSLIMTLTPDELEAMRAE